MTKEMETLLLEELEDIVQDMSLTKAEYGQKMDVDPGEVAQFRVQLVKKRLEILLKGVKRFDAVSQSAPEQGPSLL